VKEIKVDATRLPDGVVQKQQTTIRPEGFDRVLRESLSGLKFSAHAEERLARRGIELTPQELERLRGAVERIEAKGGRDSLVLVDDKAFLISIKNKTVITALSGSSVREGVFTKIDSAVVS